MAARRGVRAKFLDTKGLANLPFLVWRYDSTSILAIVIAALLARDERKFNPAEYVFYLLNSNFGFFSRALVQRLVGRIYLKGMTKQGRSE